MRPGATARDSLRQLATGEKPSQLSQLSQGGEMNSEFGI